LTPLSAASARRRRDGVGARTYAVIAVIVLLALAAAYRANRTTDTPQKPGPSADVIAPRQRGQPAADAASPMAAVEPRLTREDVVQSALRGVVTLRHVTSDGFRVTGSGFLVSARTIVTNEHVVENTTTVDVEWPTADSRKTTATVLRCSATVDLALLALSSSADGDASLVLGDVSAVRPGEDVIAVGSPSGLTGTVTRGIVSAVRSANDVTLIQTDAAINSGNSGGPLMTMRGAVIGVNTLKFVGRDVQSIAFAIGVNHVKDLIEGRDSSACGASGSRPTASHHDAPPTIVTASILPSPLALSVGQSDSVRLSATFSDQSNGIIRSELVEWSSDDPAVVRVDRSGVVTAVGTGVATVSAQVAAQPNVRADLRIQVRPK
jgi:S1-C subfamily serine protease